MKSLVLVPLFFLYAAAVPSGAASNPSRLSSSEALVEEALNQNPELRYYEAELTATRALRTTSGRLASPEISGSLGRKRTRDAGGQLAGEGTTWSVGVSQPFEWPGRLGLRKSIANQDVVLAELGLARFRFALASKVRGEAHALSASMEKARVAGEVADRYRALREVLVQREPSGITPQLELRILESTEVSLRRRAAEAGQAADDARLSLNQLLGRPVDAVLDAVVTETPFAPAPRLEELLAAAQTNNFDLRLRVADLQQQGFRVELARNERWPAFTVGPQFTEENSDGRDRILGLGVSFPLPLWRGNASKIEASKARQVQAKTLLHVARREMDRRIVSAFRTYQAKLAEIAQWQPDAVTRFAEAAELADRHYRLAAVPATTYVELQKQYLEAIETLLDTRREAIAAAAELEELTGTPLITRP